MYLPAILGLVEVEVTEALHDEAVRVQRRLLPKGLRDVERAVVVVCPRPALGNIATLDKLVLYNDNIGDEGARALAAALGNDATLTRLDLVNTNIVGPAKQLTSLDIRSIKIGAEGARALAALSCV